MKSLWTTALGLMLLIEGILPFLFPGRWRDALDRIMRLTDGQLRFLGVMALLCGLATLTLVDFFS